MKIALIGDIHYGVRNDNQSFYDYIGEHVEYMCNVLRDENVKYAIQLGDFFDRRKYVNFLTAQKAKEQFIDNMKNVVDGLFIIVGNHDIYYRHSLELNSLRIMFDNEEKITIVDEPIEFDNFLLIPWICRENYDNIMHYVENTQCEFLVGHLELNGFEVVQGVKMEHGLDPKLFEKFDMVFSGHYHEPQNKGNIFYLGSFGQFTWSDYNSQRGFYIFDTDTRELSFYPNPKQMFNIVEYDDEKYNSDQLLEIASDERLKNTYVKINVKNKTNSYLFSLFVKKIESNGVNQLQVIENVNESEVVDIDEIETEDTLKIIQEYVKKLKLDRNKENNILKEIDALYREVSR